jgi:uncharacterized iron-regulated membrane protein
VAATPKPIISTGAGPRLTDEQLKQAAIRAYPGYQVASLNRAQDLDEAVDVQLRRGDQLKNQLFDSQTGNDLGEAVQLGIWLVSKLLDLDDNLLAGPTGRKVNGLVAVVVLVLSATGLLIWWPGIKTWRRSLTLHRLAILHFGRINGIGFPCSGPGLCDQMTKAIWAIRTGPRAMFATGAIMWCNRVLRPRWQALARPTHAAVTTLHS